MILELILEVYILHIASKKTCGVTLEDDKVIEILAKEVKQRKEAMLEFEKGNRQDLVDQNKSEIEILLGYLPQQLSEEEILQIVKETATEVGADNMKDMGKLMSAVRPKVVDNAEYKTYKSNC